MQKEIFRANLACILTLPPKTKNPKVMKPKSLISIFTLLLITGMVSAQAVGALTIFSENGEKFYLILDGLRQNNVAQTNVRVDGLNKPSYTAKIIFEDKALSEISRNYLMIEDANHAMMDVTYKIKHDKNGVPKLGFMPTSFIPYQQAVTPQPDVYVVHYGTPDPMLATTTVSQTTTTTTVVPANTANVNVNGMNMNVTISDPNATTVQTTTTRTTTTSAPVESREEHRGGGEEHRGEEYRKEEHRGCREAYSMPQGDFSSALNTIKGQSFDETKLTTAKQIAGANCLSAGQITEVCRQFGFEDNKLAFAKFAYNHCTDPQNYFKVNSVFSFSSNVDALNKYVQATTATSAPVEGREEHRREEHKEGQEHHGEEYKREEHRGCREAYSMPQGDFSSAVGTIKGQSFDETKLTTAKQIVGANCLSAGQITEVCRQFNFEDNKLAFAKFAYEHCTDPQNYFKVNSVFTFSSNVDDLNKYVQSK